MRWPGSPKRLRIANVEDLALKLDPLDPRIYYLWSRVEAVFYDSATGRSHRVRGLMIDPGCAELHAVRVIAWQSNSKVNRAEVYSPTGLDGNTRPPTCKAAQNSPSSTLWPDIFSACSDCDSRRTTSVRTRF